MEEKFKCIDCNFTVKGKYGIAGVDEETLEEWSKPKYLEEMIREMYDLWNEDLEVEISGIKIEEYNY